MNIAAIDKAFELLIAQRAVHVKLGISSKDVRNYRYYIKNGITVSFDKKIELLKKSGWKETDNSFTRADMMSFAKAWAKAGQSTKDLGIVYALEKWEKKVNGQ